MKYDTERHHRKSIRLKEYDYSQAGAYFITICTKNHRHYFGKIVGDKVELSQTGETINQFWLGISEHFNNVQLDEYIIMPNHLHGIIIIDTNCRGEVSSPCGIIPLREEGRETLPLQQKWTLGHIIGYFKYQSTKYINKNRDLPGKTIWQRNYYEHIIRNEDKLNRIREYITNNPFQWKFDRENPERIQNEVYDNRWGQLEAVIYGNEEQ